MSFISMIVDHINAALGRKPTKTDRHYAEMEMDYWMRSKGYKKFTAEGIRRKKKKKHMKPGDVETMGGIERMR